MIIKKQPSFYGSASQHFNRAFIFEQANDYDDVSLVKPST